VGNEYYTYLEKKKKKRSSIISIKAANGKTYIELVSVLKIIIIIKNKK